MSYNYVYLRSLEGNDMRGQKIIKIVITMLDRFVKHNVYHNFILYFFVS